MWRSLCIGCLVLTACAAARAQSNIDAANKYAWGENVGWTNWRDANGAAQGVVVGGRVLAGFIWAENVGWINVGDGTPAGAGGFYANANGTDFGVNIASDGRLHGFGWAENAGWINFDGGSLASPAQPAAISCSGRLTGYAWGENIGWVNLADASHFVAMTPSAAPIACDVNHDGTRDGRDIQTFVNILINDNATWQDICSGDLALPKDSQITAADVLAFVTCLLS